MEILAKIQRCRWKKKCEIERQEQIQYLSIDFQASSKCCLQYQQQAFV